MVEAGASTSCLVYSPSTIQIQILKRRNKESEASIALPISQTMAKRESNAQAEAPSAKKPRVKKVTCLSGVSDEDFGNTDAILIKKELNGFVKTVAKMVNDDWHDGYEEQGAKVSEYKQRVGKILQSVYNVSVKSQMQFLRCHEIIKLVADTWANMLSIPIRGCMQEIFNEDGEKISVNNTITCYNVFRIEGGDEMAEKIWSRFLIAAVSCTNDEKVSDETLSQFIKDASDCKVNILSNPADEELNEDEQEEEEVIAAAIKTAATSVGMTRLTAIYTNKALWSALPSSLQVHKMKRGVDRRFS